MLFGIRWASLRAKIIAWSFVPTAIILAVVALVGFYAYQQVAENWTIESSREVARLSAGQLAAELAEYSSTLTALARTADIYEGKPAVQRAALEQASNRLVIFDAGAVILDNYGTVVAAGPNRLEAVGQDWSNRAYYRQMVRSPGAVFSDIVSDGPGGAPVIVVAVPITNGRGELVGTLAGMFRLGATSVSSFYGSIVKLRIGVNQNAYLVDHNGLVIYHTDSDRIGQHFAEQGVVQQVLSGKSGALRTRDISGRDIVASYSPVPGTPWGLVTEQSWDVLLASGQSYGQFLLLLLALGLVIPAVVVTIGVRRITEPILKLIAATQEVARGNLGHEITVRTGDELEELARQFNLMSAQLSESYAALKAREERFALVMRGTNDGVWDWDLKTDDVYFSPRWKSMLGYEDREIANRFEEWRRLLHPDDAERALAEVQAYLEGRTPVFQLEHRLRHKGGSYRCVLAQGIALRDADGKPYRMAGSHTDITERKQAEEEIRRQNEFLAALHTSLEAELAERARAEEALQERLAFEKLISDISTEFVNLGPEEIDAGIQHALEAVGRFAEGDRSYVFRFSEDGARMDNTHEWCRAGIEPQIQNLQVQPMEILPWSTAKIKRLETVIIPRVLDLPPEAGVDREQMRGQDIQSLILVPMAYRGTAVGFLGFDSVRTEKAWSGDVVTLLTIVGEIFVNALEHKRAQAIQVGQHQFLELLATGGDFSDTLHTLVRVIEEQWPGMLGLILLLDEDGKRLHIGAAVSLPEEYTQSLEGLEIGPMVGSCGTACYRRERVIVEDIAADPRWAGLRDLGLKYGLRACWSEPVFSSSGKVVGTVAMYYRQPRAPTEAELHTIETAAHLVGIAIEHKHAQEALKLAYQTLEQRVEERTKELAALNAVAAVVSRSLDLKEILSAAVAKTVEVIGTEAGAAYKLEESDQALILMAQRGLSDDFVQVTARLPLEVALAGKTVSLSEPLTWVVAHDYPDGELKEHIQREGWQLVVGVPLIAKDKLVGAFVLSTRTLRTLTPEEASMLMAVGRQVGVAIENARLFEERTRRANRLSQLYQANLALSASVELEEVLRRVSTVACEISDADAASLYIYDEAADSFTQAHALGAPGNWSPAHVRSTGMTRRVIREGTPILVGDTLDDPEVNPHTLEAGLRSLIATPLVSQGKPVGVLYVASYSPQRFDADDVQWVSALANQAAVVIANARLYEVERTRHAEAERRRRVAEGLREILAVLNSEQSLDETLDFIVSQACQLMACDAASLMQLEGENGWLKIQAACGLDDEYVASMKLPFGKGAAGRALAEHQPVTLPDARVWAADLARESDRAADQELAALERTMSRGYYALLSVPLIVKDKDYGAITLYYRDTRQFSEEEIRLTSSIAHQAALAIESARLREQAELAAAIAERSRLSRELHDSVTQSLYSVTLYAEAAARLLTAGDTLAAAAHLRELRDTAREALREMRLLIFELRPPALEKSGLAAALQARLDAVEIRGGIHTELQVEGAERLPFNVQEELYHIALEALNNALKHAHAQRVQIYLHFLDTAACLEVCDDGAGFEPSTARQSGGFGLSGMKERAQRIGGDLQIESTPGHGTKVTIQVPIGGLK